MGGMSWLAETAQGVNVSVRVAPRAARTAIQGPHGAALKIRLQAPPVDGRANAALIAFLAEALGVPRRDVAIESGHAGRDKRVSVRGISAAAARAALWPGD
jgi:uncharacterized protein